MDLHKITAYCQELETSGKVLPLSWKTPSFEIDEGTFRMGVGEYVKERVLAKALVKASHGTKFESLAIEDLPNSIFSDAVNAEGKRGGADPDLSPYAISAGALGILCERFAIHGIDRLNSYGYDIGSQSFEAEADKLTATMMMIEKRFPTIYPRVTRVMESDLFQKNGRNPAKEIVLKKLEAEMKEPTLATIAHIYDADPKFALSNYPLAHFCADVSTKKKLGI